MIRKKLTGVAVATVAAVLMAACSSTKANSSQPDSTGGSSTANADVAAAVAAAKANVDASTKFPTAIRLTESLPTAPPKGKTVVFIQCEPVQCHNQGDGIEAAAKAVGWNFKRLNFQAANPATLVAALKTALQYNPVGVVFSGVPQVSYQSMQAAYQKAGAFIMVDYGDAKPPTGPGILDGFGFETDSRAIGTLLADAQVTDSNGAPAKSLFVSVPAFPALTFVSDAYKDELPKICPDCHVDRIDGTIPQVTAGTLVAAIVSAAKRIDGLKYIVSVNGTFIAQLPQALKAAGLADKVKIISGKGGITDQENVLNGSQLYTVGHPGVSGGWQDMDILIRTTMGLPVPEVDHTVRVPLLTKDNIGTARESFDTPVDYADQYKKLWKIN